MTRIHNFAPGPTALPLPVLERAKEDLIEYRDTGVSILEHSHRSPTYGKVHEEAKALLREVLGVPESHGILFMQGGARGQFGLVPMNFLPQGASADYVVSGTWGEKAIKEAKIVGSAKLANPQDSAPYLRIPTPDELTLDPSAAYLHLTSNNTIYGTQMHAFPESEAPIVIDMSSDIASRPTDLSQFQMVYAGAQKNLGIPGVTLAFIDREWIEKGRADLPEIFQYRTILKGDSLQNTAPTFAIYTVRNMLDWIKAEGGVPAMAARNQRKADLLYGLLDELSDFYRAPVEKGSRSLMNVVFRLPTEDLEKSLVQEAADHGMVGIKGHRSVGGIRVSLYNAIEVAQVEVLISLLRDFAAKRG